MTTQSMIATDDTLARRSLQANALFSTLTGLLLLIAPGPIGAWLGLDAAIVLRLLGVGLLGWAIYIFRGATQERVPRDVLVTAIIGDVGWVIGSTLILAFGWLPLTTQGTWAVLIVADIIAVLAIAEYIGLRRMTR